MREDLFDEKVWFPPEHLPDLSGEKIVAVDVETKDPNLRDLGPGWIRKDGNLIGVSVAASGWSAYLPIAHEGGGNMAKRAWRSGVEYSIPWSLRPCSMRIVLATP